jgi:hypothetical protein
MYYLYRHFIKSVLEDCCYLKYFLIWLDNLENAFFYGINFILPLFLLMDFDPYIFILFLYFQNFLLFFHSIIILDGLIAILSKNHNQLLDHHTNHCYF